MIKHSFKSLWIVFVAFCLMAVTSCSGVIGYGVLLWNDTENNIADGEILAVYLKSNITKQYVVSLPGSKEKIEIPLWKLTTPSSRRDAVKQAAKYKEYEHMYAKCVLDGLPIRAEAVNTAKQLYRLRKDEIVRVLYEGKGGVVTNGKENFEGKWFRVLAADGTPGWCFSYNLRLFEMYADGTFGEGAEVAEVQEIDSALNGMLAKRWYPDYYSSMINSGDYNLDYMKASYGFDAGSATGVISLHMNGVDFECPYNGVTKISSQTYKFNDTKIQVTIRSSSSITLQYMNSDGNAVLYSLVTLENADISELVKAERLRRDELYESIRIAGPVYTSSNYGVLSFKEGNVFEWTGNDRLVPSLIPSFAGKTGVVNFMYALPKSYAANWDGVISLKFDGMERSINFLYKVEANGIRISTVNVIEKSTTVTQPPAVTVQLPSNSTVIFFQN